LLTLSWTEGKRAIFLLKNKFVESDTKNTRKSSAEVEGIL